MPTNNLRYERRNAELRAAIAVRCLKYIQRESITKQTFAQRLGVSPSRLKSLLNSGSAEISLDTLIRIAAVTGEPITI